MPAGLLSCFYVQVHPIPERCCSLPCFWETSQPHPLFPTLPERSGATLSPTSGCFLPTSNTIQRELLKHTHNSGQGVQTIDLAKKGGLGEGRGLGCLPTMGHRRRAKWTNHPRERRSPAYLLLCGLPALLLACSLCLLFSPCLSLSCQHLQGISCNPGPFLYHTGTSGELEHPSGQTFPKPRCKRRCPGRFQVQGGCGD